MNNRGKWSLFISSLALSAVIVGLSAFGPSAVVVSAQSGNMTDSSQIPTNDSQGISGLMPESALQSVIEQTQSANATSFAIETIINQTGQGSEDATMEDVMEEAMNTNATSFAAESIINQTPSGSNMTTN